MPDRDEFDGRIRRGWRPAARAALLHDEHPDALYKTVRALQTELKCQGFGTGGIPGINKIVDIIVAAQVRLASESCELVLGESLSCLDELRPSCARTRSEEAFVAARKLLVRCAMEADQASLDLTKDRVGTAIDLLSLLARGRLSSNPLLRELADNKNVSPRQHLARLDRIEAEFAKSSDARRLATQLLDDPTGASVTLVRRAARPSQSELLAMSLT